MTLYRPQLCTFHGDLVLDPEAHAACHTLDGLVAPEFIPLEGPTVATLEPIKSHPGPVQYGWGHDHSPVQHRDGKPPWCNVCGRTSNGVHREDIAGRLDRRPSLAPVDGVIGGGPLTMAPQGLDAPMVPVPDPDAVAADITTGGLVLTGSSPDGNTVGYRLPDGRQVELGLVEDNDGAPYPAEVQDAYRMAFLVALQAAYR